MNEDQANRIINLLQEISYKLDTANDRLCSIEPAAMVNDIDSVADKIDDLIKVSEGIKTAIEEGF